MGNFEIVKTENLKSYTAFSKQTFKNIIKLDHEMPMYEFVPERRYSVDEIFFDTPNNLLASAGIILSKVIEDGKAYFKIEREEYSFEKRLSSGRKVFIQPAGLRDTIVDHTLFLTDGISSMFSTKFNIDFQNVFKMAVPKLELNSKIDVLKILSGVGFKGEISFEEIKIINYFTKRKSDLNMVTIEQKSSSVLTKEFQEFATKLEKYCKELTLTNESKYQIAIKMTKLK